MNDINEKTQAPKAEKKKAAAKRIGKEQVEKARIKLEMFKAAKGTINNTIKFNEQWFRRRYQEYAGTDASGYALIGDTEPRKRGELVSPQSAWLFNSVMNFVGDASDNRPRANIIPQEAQDEEEAYLLGKVIPVELRRMGFEKVYDDNQYVKGTQGWCLYTHGCDRETKTLYVKDAQILNFYWDLEKKDIQESSDIFYLTQMDRDELIREYPELEREASCNDGDYERYDGNPSNGKPTKVTVVDWYYKKRNKDRKRVLHYCKFVGDVVLYASENDAELSEVGWYEHGDYPFEIDVLYPLQGQAAGFGKVAVGLNTQQYIDYIGKALVQNALWGSRPRYFYKESAGINESDFLDVNKTLVKYQGSGGREEIFPIEVPRIDGNVLNLQASMIDEQRTNSGTTEVATGATPGGVTAAQAIGALQEAQGKQGRLSNRSSYECYKRIVYKLISLIRQFYDEDHFYRIVGEDGEAQYVTYNGRTAVKDGRHPAYDIDVTTEKQSEYTRMSNNDLMLDFFSVGFFSPQLAPQALACLQQMDFDGKDELIRIIRANMEEQGEKEALARTLMEYARVIDELNADRSARDAADGLPSEDVPSYVEQTQAVLSQILGGAEPQGRGRSASLSGSMGPGIIQARKEAASVASPT
jgi:hypothetical protein